MKILACLRGRPGLGHVTPGLVLLDYMKKNIAGCEILICSYDNGISFLKETDYKVVDLNINPSYECWAGLNVIDDLLLKVQPVIQDFGPDFILSSGEYLLPVIQPFTNARMGLIYNPEVLMAKAHNRPYKDLFCELFSRCEVLIANGYPLQQHDIWEEAQQVYERSVKTLLVRSPRLPVRQSVKKTFLVGNGGGVSLPANTSTYSNSADLVQIWKKQNVEFLQHTLSIIKEECEGEEIEVHAFLCVDQPDYLRISDQFREDKRFLFYAFSPLYIDILAIANLVVTRAGVSSIMEIEHYNKQAIIWPLYQHAEQIKTVEEVAGRNTNIGAWYETAAFKTLFREKMTKIAAAGTLVRQQATDDDFSFKTIVDKLIKTKI